MNPLSAIMGLADLICIGIILFFMGLNIWTGILCFIMVAKGGMSFL